MELQILLSLCIIVLTFVILFGVGIVIGLFIGKNNANTNYEKPESFLKKNYTTTKQDKKQISIDDTKVVIGVDTDGLEKKFDQITESVKTKNDVQTSVNKLKRMKGD